MFACFLRFNYSSQPLLHFNPEMIHLRFRSSFALSFRSSVHKPKVSFQALKFLVVENLEVVAVQKRFRRFKLRHPLFRPLHLLGHLGLFHRRFQIHHHCLKERLNKNLLTLIVRVCGVFCAFWILIFLAIYLIFDNITVLGLFFTTVNNVSPIFPSFVYSVFLVDLIDFPILVRIIFIFIRSTAHL